MKLHDHHDSRGLALIFVIGVLALLAALSVTFCNVTSMERNTSHNYVLATRAKLAAEAGIDSAIGRLQDWVGATPDVRYFDGVNYNRLPLSADNPAVRPAFSIPENPAISGVVSATYAAAGDSFALAIEAEDGKLNINDSNGTWNIDTDTGIDGDPEKDAADMAAAEGRLLKTLESLATVLFDDESLGRRVAETLMTARDARFGGKFPSLDAARAVLVPDILDESRYAQLESHLTLNSWQNPHVIRPTYQCAISTPIGVTAEIPEDWKRDMYLWLDFQTRRFENEPRCPVNLNLARRELLESLIRPLQGWYLRDGPGSAQSLNMDEGGGRNVFRCETDDARLTGSILMQYYWQDAEEFMLTGRTISAGGELTPDLTFRDNATSRLGQPFLTPDLDLFVNRENTTLPAWLANALVDRIHGGPETPGDPIETWQELEFVLDELLAAFFGGAPADGIDLFWRDWTPKPQPYEMPERWGSMWARYAGEFHDPFGIDMAFWREHCRGILRDLLLAAFNPNSQLNDFNPDKSHWRFIDKAQLTRYTTELSLQIAGTFRIRSAGIVSDSRQILARHALETLIEVGAPFQITTQAQFMKNFRQPSDFGQSADGLGLRHLTWNTLVESYPEPVLQMPDGPIDGGYLSRSLFDGYVKPSTLRELAPGSTLTQARLWAGFEGKLDAVDMAGGRPVDVFMTGTRNALWTSTRDLDGNVALEQRGSPVYQLRNLPREDALTCPANPAADYVPGCLTPDGALSDASRNIAYPATYAGSDLGSRGAVSFWFKPNFDPAITTRIRDLFDISRPRANTQGAQQHAGLWLMPHYGLNSEEVLGNAYAGPSFAFTHRNLSPCSLLYRVQGAYGADTGQTKVVTPTVVRRYPNQWPDQSARHHTYHVEAHTWSYAIIGWDYHRDDMRTGADRVPSSGNRLARYLNINNWNPVEQDSPRQAQDGYAQRTALLPMEQPSPCYIHYLPGVWMRFGGMASEASQNYTGDITVDEIIAWNQWCTPRRGDRPGSPGYTTALTTGVITMPTDNQLSYRRRGRYYLAATESTLPVYVSPAWDVFHELRTGAASLRILRASWTLQWPMDNQRHDYRGMAGLLINAPLTPRFLNDPRRDRQDPADPVAIRMNWQTGQHPGSLDIGVQRESGDIRWACDSNGNGDIYDDSELTFAGAGGSRIETPITKQPVTLQKGDQLRFRFYFNAVRQGGTQVAYSAPLLDDVTFFLRTMRVLEWKSVLS